MPFLIAAVVILAVLCLLNLLLTFGVIRKLRVQRAEPYAGDDPGLMLPNGSAVPAFAADTLDGGRISQENLRNALIGFVSTTCSACKEQLPHFLDVAGQHRALGRPVVTFVHGDAEEARALAEPLRAVGQVVVEDAPHEGPTERAFRIEGYPVFGIVDATGTLVASNIKVRKLPVPAPVG
ncbi:TlpA family protein disulfide reductase [Streptomyces sp. NPDC088755]|uniref:TlpA family protein disulfide reductase n=1 Tax=Streptomyces sp. NPDC088755 TaxID=3365888 RepID=UPI0038217E5E